MDIILDRGFLQAVRQRRMQQQCVFLLSLKHPMIQNLVEATLDAGQRESCQIEVDGAVLCSPAASTSSGSLDSSRSSTTSSTWKRRVIHLEECERELITVLNLPENKTEPWPTKQSLNKEDWWEGPSVENKLPSVEGANILDFAPESLRTQKLLSSGARWTVQLLYSSVTFCVLAQAYCLKPSALC
jgi:hypothetical protein